MTSPIGSIATEPPGSTLYQRLAPPADVGEDEVPARSLSRIFQGTGDGAQPIFSNWNRSLSSFACQADGRAISADQRSRPLDRGRQALAPGKRDTDRAAAFERLDGKAVPERVGTDRIPVSADRQNRREQELLRCRVPVAVIVQVDPEVVLEVGEEPVAVAVHAPYGVRAAGEFDLALEIPRRGVAEGDPGGPEAKDGRPAKITSRFALDDRQVERECEVRFSPSTRSAASIRRLRLAST